MSHISRGDYGSFAGDEPDDIFRLDATFETGPAASSGECTPAMDVFETPDAFEVVLDLPGVAAEQLQLVFARGMLIVAGRKRPAACKHRDAAFHLAERSFGRFMRAIRVSAPVDAGRATAQLAGGQLRVVIPRIAERRGREFRIAIEQS